MIPRYNQTRMDAIIGLSKRWRYRAGLDDLAPQASALAQELGVPPLVARLLVARGISNDDTAQHFLQPKLADLHAPALLPGATRAAQRICQSIEQKQPIVIYGDYDVDGVTASSLLWHVLKLAGACVYTYVPHRIDEGYGLNNEAIARLSQGVDRETCGGFQACPEVPPGKPLIISVDCGITAVGPAQVAKQTGVDLIITDHHEFNADALPDAYALVHPRLPHSPYPFGDLCGAGVAFKLAWLVAKTRCGSERVPAEFKALLLDCLSLASLGTVADIVPLVGENRVIATFGLGQIKRTRFAGLNAMIDAARLREEKVDAYHVGFVLGPRLNACGRMGHARHAVHLLTDADDAQAREIAQFLTKENESRQATEKKIFKEAVEMVVAQGFDSPDHRAIVLGKEGWHQGVVGIVASRLVEEFSRPVVMLSYSTDSDTGHGRAHGSARSVDGVSIHEALHHCASCLTTFGGHAMAAGMRLDVNNVDEFRRLMVEFVNARLRPDDLVGVLDIDTICELSDINLRTLEQIEKLAPFGRCNPSPVLCVADVMLDEPGQRLGKTGQHLKLFLRQNGRNIAAVGWNMGDMADDLPRGVHLDVAFEPRISTWNGMKRAEMTIRDLRVHG